MSSKYGTQGGGIEVILAIDRSEEIYHQYDEYRWCTVLDCKDMVINFQKVLLQKKVYATSLCIGRWTLPESFWTEISNNGSSISS